MKVTLTWFEIFIASQVGMRRHIEALQRNLPDRNGADKDNGWTLHVEGACGELAFAKAAGRYWSGSVNTFKDGGDVGSIQVRTRSKPFYELIVREDDRDSDIFVLVLGKAPSFEVVGWVHGAWAKRQEWLKEHGGRQPAYFVPHEALRPIIDLSSEAPRKKAA